MCPASQKYILQPEESHGSVLLTIAQGVTTKVGLAPGTHTFEYLMRDNNKCQYQISIELPPADPVTTTTSTTTTTMAMPEICPTSRSLALRGGRTSIDVTLTMGQGNAPLHMKLASGSHQFEYTMQNGSLCQYTIRVYQHATTTSTTTPMTTTESKIPAKCPKDITLWMVCSATDSSCAQPSTQVFDDFLGVHQRKTFGLGRHEFKFRMRNGTICNYSITVRKHSPFNSPEDIIRKCGDPDWSTTNEFCVKKLNATSW